MPSPSDHFWVRVELGLLKALKPLLPGARSSLVIVLKIQDGRVVSIAFRGRLQFRQGELDGAPAGALTELFDLLSREYAVAVQFGAVAFRLRNWKVLDTRVIYKHVNQEARQPRRLRKKKR